MGINYLAYRIFHAQLENQRENCLVSSLGIHELLTIVYENPRDKSEEDYAIPVNLRCFYEYGYLPPRHYQDYLNHFNSVGQDIFRISTKAFLKENLQLQSPFKSLLLNNFLSGLEAVDFVNREATSNSLNSWLQDNTSGMLKTVNELETDTQFALLNAMDFKGKWSQEFNVEDTTPELFYMDGNKSVEVPMMKMRAEVYYKKMTNFFNCEIIQLPYTKDEFDVYVILSTDDMSIRDFVGNTRLNLSGQLDDMVLQKVDISIPRFKIENVDDLKDNLKENNLEKEIDNEYIFGLLENEDWLEISKIQQLGAINFHEKGTEAATGTIFTLVPSNATDQDFISKDDLVIYEMNIKSKISNRFAKTLVTSKVKNANTTAKEASFIVRLPETAFITEFLMEIDGTVHKSHIKGKNEAKTIYTEAVSVGRTAGLVESSVRDSNEFEVSVNLEPQSTAVFSLTYEEMLQRVHDRYELVLNIKPGEIVKNLNIEVEIEESRPLKFVKVPAIRSGQEIRKEEDHLKPSTEMKIGLNSAVIKYNPTPKQQKMVACYLGTNISDGFSGQFVVQYDVEREPQNGEVLLQDGYFVHFFAPNDLDPLPTHVVFVLDTSSSMIGGKISQLKNAMSSILDEIRPTDLISIVEFNHKVIVWDINSETRTVIESINLDEPFSHLKTMHIPPPIGVNAETLKKAKNVVQDMVANGSTYIIGGLITGLFLIKQKKAERDIENQPIIVFLTDGQPNVGMSCPEEIVKTVTSLNSKNNNVPIFSLSFGKGADKDFLRKLSTKNMGFSRHIYEASDASLQLQASYKQISSPLLTDVKFNYTPDVADLTKTSFPIYFKGGEIVVSGTYSNIADELLHCVSCAIECNGAQGTLTLHSTIHHPVSSLERLWAYLTVKQLLSVINEENDAEVLKKATELALKYSFVTDVTSLVVVRPDRIPLGDNNVPNAFLVEELPEDCTVTEIITRDGKPKKKVIRKRLIKGKGRAQNVVVEKEEKKTIPKFTANRPFLLVLKMKKGNSNSILLLAHVNKIGQ